MLYYQTKLNQIALAEAEKGNKATILIKRRKLKRIVDYIHKEKS